MGEHQTILFEVKRMIQWIAKTLVGLWVLAQPFQAVESSECCNSPLSIACPRYLFTLEAEALYLQPTASNLHYCAEAQPLPLPSPDWFIDDIDPDYHWGFEIGATAFLTEQYTKLKVNWTHLHATDSATHSIPVGTQNMVGPFFEIGPDGAPYTLAKGHVKFEYDAINLDYGIGINFCDCATAYLSAGIGGVRIKEDLTFFYVESPGTISRSIKTPTTFWGAGPQLDLDLNFRLCQGLQLVGKGTTTLFVGSSKKPHRLLFDLSPSDPVRCFRPK